MALILRAMVHTRAQTVAADQTIIWLIRAYAVARGVAVSTAARQLTGSGDTILRMERDGMSLTARRAENIIQTASDRWPPNTDWPEVGIPRPEPSASSGDPAEVA